MQRNVNHENMRLCKAVLLCDTVHHSSHLLYDTANDALR